ncbi:4Fe-4S binding protein [Microvirga sp. CF3016]|uniref:4Fe-4S binding protein n=1 Tax=Microvirga sp. CF3016 TaxID=3110181 RepID=UPI002E7A23A0|nr:4Fe-4S binding protein [Microvirga sp. CF3016]MEE1609822.1 4Fe-4S binding protein [Microvirga sp. CF3016]
MSEASTPNRRNFLLGRFTAAEPVVELPIAVITPACLALQGVACMSCRDACPTGAVRFGLAVGGARPWIEADACTGCRECAPACPVDAIHLPAAKATT